MEPRVETAYLLDFYGALLTPKRREMMRMRYEEDMRLILPSDLTRFRNVMDSPLLREAGRIYERKNDVWDFERVPKRLPETALKFYGEGRSREGVCGSCCDGGYKCRERSSCRPCR